jgi:hypothetical protein
MDQAKELLEMPREFLKDGQGFITRCSKRESSPTVDFRPSLAPYSNPRSLRASQGETFAQWMGESLHGHRRMQASNGQEMERRESKKRKLLG